MFDIRLILIFHVIFCAQIINSQSTTSGQNSTTSITVKNFTSDNASTTLSIQNSTFLNVTTLTPTTTTNGTREPESGHLSNETLVFLIVCSVLVVLGYIWLNYHIFTSIKSVEKCVRKYDKWYQKLQSLEQESGKWCKLYWKFEQNNMILEILDSPRYWPVQPVDIKPMVNIEFRDRPLFSDSSAARKGITHFKLPEHHFVGHHSTLTRLLTDPEYLHSVEIYSRHLKDESSKFGTADWNHFRQSGSREGVGGAAASSRKLDRHSSLPVSNRRKGKKTSPGNQKVSPRNEKALLRNRKSESSRFRGKKN